MRSIRVLAAILIILAFPIETSDLLGSEHVWAQATQHYDGEYTVTDVDQSTDKRGVWVKSSQIQYVPRRLFLSTYPGKNTKYQGKLVYAWVNNKGKAVEYSVYDITKPGSIWLCASQFSGDVEQLAGQSKYRVRLFTPPGRGFDYRFTLEMQGGITGNPFPEGDPACTGSGGVVSKGDVTAAAVRWPFLALLQNLPSTRRVNGQFFVSVHGNNDPHPATDADRKQWACLATKGFPALQLVEFSARPGGDPEDVYVWPDGHFQAVVAGGARYEWRLGTTECATTPQSSRNRFSVPGDPSGSEEKIVLACFLADGKFADCDSWWLRRP